MNRGKPAAVVTYHASSDLSKNYVIKIGYAYYGAYWYFMVRSANSNFNVNQ